MKSEGILEYLKKRWRANRWRRVMGFRLRNVVRERRRMIEECVGYLERRLRRGSMCGRSVEKRRKEGECGKK